MVYSQEVLVLLSFFCLVLFFNLIVHWNEFLMINMQVNWDFPN